MQAPAAIRYLSINWARVFPTIRRLRCGKPKSIGMTISVSMPWNNYSPRCGAVNRPFFGPLTTLIWLGIVSFTAAGNTKNPFESLPL